MGLFDNIFSKNNVASGSDVEVVAATKAGHIGEAEQIAKVVDAGIKNENYSEMNKHLSIISHRIDEKEMYVFEHPGVISRYYAIALILLVSASFVYYLSIGALTAFLSEELHSIGMFLVCLSATIIIINIALIIKIATAIRFKSRFDVYEELLGYKSLEYIDDLAICSKQKASVVIKDLKRAVKRKLIPQGHFSAEYRVFMVADDIYTRYLEKPAVYDRYFQKVIEERQRVKSRTKRISQIMETGEQYISKIHGYGTIIKDKNVSRKIGRMENVVSMIFHEIDVNPKQAQFLGVFLNYYLPTTEKLLEAYVSIDENKASNKNTAQTKKEIEDAINKIVSSYESILERLYEEYEMDISADIEAMELSMKQEGLSK